MLHNSGPYGPNEAPINMGTTVNITPMSAPVNLGQNLDNLGKNLQQPAQTASQHYNLPDYSSYRPPSLNMPHQISPFHSYQTGTIQSNYVLQNTGTALAHNSSWQNGMYPTTMNTHTNFRPNMLNYPANYGKQAPNATVIQEFESQMTYPKTMPINIPQVPTKPFQNINDDAYSLYNVNKDRFNNYHNSLELKCQEKPLIDSNKRKSLENTVRLIEDILENTAKNKEIEKNARDAEKRDKVLKENNIVTAREDSNHMNVSKTEEDNSKNFIKPQSTSNLDTLIQPEDLITEANMFKTEAYLLETEADTLLTHGTTAGKQTNINQNNDVANNTIKNKDEPILIESSIEPIRETENIPLYDNVCVKVEIEEPTVTVKVEEMNWTDLEFGNLFHRDVNGITREELGDRVFIDGDCSVDVATADIKNAIPSNTYYECPHCNLCFDQPKRFLIHHKWHAFGTSHNKHADIFKKKEAKRTRKIQPKEEEMSLNNEDTPKKFSCKDCQKEFFSKSSLKTHRLRVHSTRVRECKVCKKQITGFMAMRSHLASHDRDKEPTFQCPECKKMFRHKHTLAKHRDTHLEKTVACEQCPKKYGSVKQLKMHMKVHERAERGPSHTCSYCPKTFYETYSLQVHERLHRDERPFGCDICSTHFATNSSLKRHMKVSHSTLKPFECSHCHRCFISAAIRDAHEARLHGDPEQFKFRCELCDCRYYKMRDLQKHMNKKHPKRKKLKNEANISDSE